MEMLLKLWSTGDNVILLQKQLNTKLNLKLQIDGTFGNKTRDAVITFEKTANLNADGIVTDEVWSKLFGTPPSVAPQLISPPQGLVNWYKVFGDPMNDPNFSRKIQFCDLSKNKDKLSHVLLGWDHSKKGFETIHGFGIYCHYLTIPQWKEAFSKICENNLHNQIHTYDGCFNVRKVRGGNSLSPHSWGMAIDLNASENPLGSTNYRMDLHVVDVFEALKFQWGGRWRRCDAMHYQFALY
jgi:hypothetical protein